MQPYTSADFRFTTRGNTLYALAMGWPDNGTLTVQTVSLLGHGDVPFQQTADGLVDTLPPDKAVRPCLCTQDHRPGPACPQARAADPAPWQAMNLASVSLTRMGD